MCYFMKSEVVLSGRRGNGSGTVRRGPLGVGVVGPAGSKANAIRAKMHPNGLGEGA